MIVTVSYGRVRGRARQYLYWQACLYDVKPRKKDGVTTARLVCTIGEARRSLDKALQEAIAYANEHGYVFKAGVRQNMVISPPHVSGANE